MNKYLPVALLGFLMLSCACNSESQPAREADRPVVPPATEPIAPEAAAPAGRVIVFDEPFAPRISGRTRRAVLAPAPEWEFEIDPANLSPMPPRVFSIPSSEVSSGTAPMPFGYSMFGPWDTEMPRPVQIALPITPTRPR